MAIYDDEQTDNIALQNLLAQQGSAMPSKPKAEAAFDMPGSMPTMPGAAGGGIQAPVDPNKALDPTAPKTEGPDTSKWDTDGYAKPGYTASNAYGAPAGFDQTKWGNADKQSPKYVVGRILQEAAGGAGNLADPEKRAAGVQKVLEAYPGSTYNGKDKITFPDGGTVDVFGKAGAGLYEIAWMPETGPGGAPLPQDNGGPSGMIGVGPSSTERINSLVPTDTSTYQALMQKLQGIIGPQATDRNALMELMNRDVK